LAQDVSGLRVLIVDDASPDDTPEVAQALMAEDARVSCVRHTANRGHIATYNEGIEWARADYLLLLSADDYLLPGALARATALLDGDASLGLCFGPVMELHDDGRLVRAEEFGPRSRVMRGRNFIELCGRLGCINIVPAPSAVVRTALQKSLGGYRAELPHSGDMELWLRIAAHADVGYVSQPQAVYRRHGANMSHGYEGAHRLRDLAQRRDAVEWLCRGCSEVLPDAPAVRRRLLRQLALDAAGCASAALNNNDRALFEQCRELALALDAGVTRTRQWQHLRLKQLLGRRASAALLRLRERLVAQASP
jgi:glycosyltransferase involved in cell wall biosynthesis